MPRKKAESYTNSKELPIYKQTTNILDLVDNLMNNVLRRDVKHTYGQHMLSIVIDMLGCISQAYLIEEERVNHLKRYIAYLDNLSTLLNLCERKGYLVGKKGNEYVGFIKPMASVEAQVQGWLKSTTQPESE